MALIRMHLKNTSDTLLLILCCIQDIGTCVASTRIHTEICKPSDKRIGDDLEDQRCKRCVVGGRPCLRVAVKIRTCHIRDIRRGRHIGDHSIQQLLNSLVLMSRTTENRDCLVLDCCLAECFLQIIDGRFLAIEILHHQLFIKVADLFNKLCMSSFSLILHVVRDIDNRNVLALRVIVDISLHLKQIDNALEVIFLTDRKLDDNRVLAQLCHDLVNGIREVCSQDIHLVDKCNTRNTVFVCLTPDIL